MPVSYSKAQTMTDQPDNRPTVLIVEDHDEMATMMRRILEEDGWTVHRAADGKEAKELIGRLAPPALVTLDIRLPDTKGEDLILPEECLVFEDSVPGVEAGRRAGMRVVWCPHPMLKNEFAGREKEVLAGLAREQRPYATILGCSDSRVPPELIFDASFGELFIVRVAGNVIVRQRPGTAR